MCICCVRNTLKPPRSIHDFVSNYSEAGGPTNDMIFNDIGTGIRISDISSQTTRRAEFGPYKNTPEDVQRAVRETTAA